MRANDFVHNKKAQIVQEEREQLDEILPAIVGAVWIAGMGWTAYDTWKNVQAYNRGEITLTQLGARVGVDVAAAAVGGVVGKGLATGGKLAYKTGKAVAKGAKAVPKAVSKAQDAMQKGINVVTGKPLKTVPKKPPKKPSTATKTGQTTGTAASQGKNLGQAVGANVRKAGEKFMKKPGRTTAGAALIGMKATGLDDKLSQGFVDAWDKLSKGTSGGSAGDIGDGVVYFGKEKNPPIKKVQGVNDPLYTKPGTDSKYTKPDTVKPKTIDSKTMDSNSPVPTAKDPKLPKQNTTSLATQSGVK